MACSSPGRSNSVCIIILSSHSTLNDVKSWNNVSSATLPSCLLETGVWCSGIISLAIRKSAPVCVARIIVLPLFILNFFFFSSTQVFPSFILYSCSSSSWIDTFTCVLSYAVDLCRCSPEPHTPTAHSSGFDKLPMYSMQMKVFFFGFISAEPQLLN